MCNFMYFDFQTSFFIFKKVKHDSEVVHEKFFIITTLRYRYLKNYTKLIIKIFYLTVCHPLYVSICKENKPRKKEK